MAKVDELRKTFEYAKSMSAELSLSLEVSNIRDTFVTTLGTIKVGGTEYSKEEAVRIANWILDVCLDK